MIDRIEPTPQQILDLKSLLQLKEWATYKTFLEDEIRDCAEIMFTKDDNTEKQRDALINRRNNLKYALELPELIIEQSTPRPEPKPIDNEVYKK